MYLLIAVLANDIQPFTFALQSSHRPRFSCLASRHTAMKCA